MKSGCGGACSNLDSEIFRPFPANSRDSASTHFSDSTQLSCVAAMGNDLFITIDTRLSGAKAPGVQFIVALDRAPI
jgi:hypothetical protein